MKQWTVKHLFAFLVDGTCVNDKLKFLYDTNNQHRAGTCEDLVLMNILQYILIVFVSGSNVYSSLNIVWRFDQHILISRSFILIDIYTPFAIILLNQKQKYIPSFWIMNCKKGINVDICTMIKNQDPNSEIPEYEFNFLHFYKTICSIFCNVIRALQRGRLE